MSPENVKSRCDKWSDLTDQDKDIIVDYSKHLQEMADSRNCDVFIDVLSKDGSFSYCVAYAYCKKSYYPKNLNIEELVVRECDEPAVFRTLRFGIKSENYPARTYVNTPGNRINQTTLPIFNDKKTVAALIFERAVEEEHIVEEPREISIFCDVDLSRFPYAQGIRWLAECTDEAVYLLDEEKTVIYRNKPAVELRAALGFADEILGKSDTYDIIEKLHVGPTFSNSFYEEEKEMVGFVLRIKEYCYFADDYFYIIVIHDITAEKKYTERMEWEEFMNRETHHRVKNNLQNVLSLLDLQRRRSGPETEEPLRDAMSRIMSIAHAYDASLTAGAERRDYNDGALVSLQTVLTLQKNKFQEMFLNSQSPVTINISGEHVWVNTNTASNIALVINELLQNSFKYAFRGRDGGRIDIQITNYPLYPRIIYSDNGSGFDPDSVNRGDKGLGLQIVRQIIVNQLKGYMEIRSGPKGTDVTFYFRSSLEP